jgi:hypothetical protein
MAIDRAIFQATFSDLKIIRGRKVGQIVLEVPIEGVDQALRALGGVPRPDAEVWVAVARLDPKAVQHPPTPAEAPKKHSLTQQAGILCNEPRFRTFLTEKMHPEADAVDNAEYAVEVVRDICEVKSRAEFDKDPEAGARWRELHAEYLLWLNQ